MAEFHADRRWTPRTALARFVEVAGEEGARTLWFRVWGELCYRRLALFELPLDAPVRPFQAQVALELAPLGERDAGGYAALRPGADAAEIAPRLAAGHRCFAARRGDELVGTCWVAFGSLWSAYLRGPIQLGPEEACTYETYTAPAARGLGIGPALTAHIAAELRAAGCRRLLSTVDPDRRPAIRVVEKLGCRRVGTLGYFGAGPWRREFSHMVAGPSPPGWGAGASAARRIART